MKSPPHGHLRPTSAEATSFEEIEAMRVRLVRAQNEENDAIRKLGRLSELAGRNKGNLAKLTAEARTTRERAIAAYNELVKFLEKVERDADGRRADRKL